MADKCVIGIQARSTSTRLPGKCTMKVTSKDTVLDMVIESCRRSVDFLNRGNDVECELALLVPKGDPIKAKYCREVFTIEGSEEDCLSRYIQLAEVYPKANYICRITSDCPLLPANVITRHILTAAKRNADFVTNAYLDYRTSPDGHDVEVLSRKALSYMAQCDLDAFYREHVTLHLKEHPPEWLACVGMFNHLNLSSIKISVDTPGDLENVKVEHQELRSIIDSFVKETGHGIYFY